LSDFAPSAFEFDARHAEVPVVRAVELPVVKLRRDGLRAAEFEAELDDAVLVGMSLPMTA
jgi:hypothetical protein